MPARLELRGLRQMIEVEKLTHSAAAKRLGCSISAVERRVKKMGLSTQRSGPRSGSGHPNWKGGRSVDPKGYVWIYAPEHPNCTKHGRRVAEHRIVAEAKLGRLLLRTEVVHHRDGDPGNNDPANLEVFATNADHLRHELTGNHSHRYTPEVREKISAAIRKARSQKKSKRDEPRNTRTTGRHSS